MKWHPLIKKYWFLLVPVVFFLLVIFIMGSLMTFPEDNYTCYCEYLDINSFDSVTVYKNEERTIILGSRYENLDSTEYYRSGHEILEDYYEKCSTEKDFASRKLLLVPDTISVREILRFCNNVLVKFELDVYSNKKITMTELKQHLIKNGYQIYSDLNKPEDSISISIEEGKKSFYLIYEIPDRKIKSDK